MLAISNASSTILARQIFDVWHFGIPKDDGLPTVLVVGRPTVTPSFLEQFAPTLPKAVNYFAVVSVGVLFTVAAIVTTIHITTMRNILAVVAL